MVRPITHADPAELVLALPAIHVVAPLVLLDAGGTLGAALGVGQDPVGRLRLVLALFVPRRQLSAAGRRVGLAAALEAELGFARVAVGDESAGGGCVQHLLGADGDALASGSRAPAGEGVALDEVAELVGPEFGVGVGGEGLVFLLGDDLLAAGLRAGLADADGSVGQGHVEEAPPAVAAELVAAGHAEHLVGAEAILVVADAALPLLLLLGGAGGTAVGGGGSGGGLLVAVIVVVVAGTGQHAAGFEQLVGIVVERLEESLLGPLVLPHEGGRGTGRDVEDFGHLLEPVIHYWDEILGAEHLDGIGLVAYNSSSTKLVYWWAGVGGCGDW